MGKKRPQARAPGLTLDAGALIALDRGDRRMIALLRQALATGVVFRVPAGAMAQAWRSGARQAVLARFLRAREVQIKPLDEHLARACGELCAAAGTADIVDASVVLVAREHGDVVLSSDPDDLARLDPKISVASV